MGTSILEYISCGPTVIPKSGFYCTFCYKAIAVCEWWVVIQKDRHFYCRFERNWKNYYCLSLKEIWQIVERVIKSNQIQMIRRSEKLKKNLIHTIAQLVGRLFQSNFLDRAMVQFLVHEFKTRLSRGKTRKTLQSWLIMYFRELISKCFSLLLTAARTNGPVAHRWILSANWRCYCEIFTVFQNVHRICEKLWQRHSHYKYSVFEKL